MFQRFAAMWLLLATLAMSAHGLVVHSLPTLTGLLITAILLMPCAAVAARLNHRIATIGVAVIAQVIAHSSLTVPGLSLHNALDSVHHLHAEHTVLHQTVAVNGHGHVTAVMLAAHVVSATILSMVLHRVDDFLGALGDLFAVFIRRKLIVAIPVSRRVHNLETVVVAFCSCLDSRAHPHRGPPLPLFT